MKNRDRVARILAAIYAQTGQMPDVNSTLIIETQISEAWTDGFAAGRSRRASEREEMQRAEARINGAA